MRFCTTHRACESANKEWLTCEVAETAWALEGFWRPGWRDCTLVDALIVPEEDGEWPEWAAKAVSSFLEVDEDGAAIGRKPNPKKLDELLQAQIVALAQSKEGE